MTLTNSLITLITFLTALALSLILTPAARSAAVVLNIFDHPTTSVKTHREPVPYLGGVAIFLAFALALIWIRVLTSFPSGTLRSLRGILAGSTVMFLMGLVDDIKHHGLHYRTKFFFQIAAACMVMFFGIRIKFITPSWLGYAMTIIWIVGITNAFNLIDIMDGLASGLATVATLAFIFITLPTEEIYVNIASAALCGAVLGFFPYNVSKKWRLFMGDCGSLLLGFICSSLALGTSYGKQTEWGVFAPLLILCLPIFDTILVFTMRIRKGVSPFLGSKDHFGLRLELLGWPRKSILIFSIAFATLLCTGAYVITRSSSEVGFVVYATTAILLAAFTAYIVKAKVL